IGIVSGGPEEAADILDLQGLQHARDLLGLRFRQRQIIDDDRFLVLKLAQERHARRRPYRFFRQMVLVIARLWSLGRAAAFALVGTPRAHAGVAGSLLAKQFLRAAADLAAAQGRM